MPARRKAYSYSRFSSPAQAKGDSLRRQRTAAQDFAASHEMELVELEPDEGISAYRGANRTFGELKAILMRIDNGVIKKGDTLIVESLDRLSRESSLRAFELLNSIVSRGVDIATLSDNQIYSADSLGENPGQLFMALGSMIRAHDESAVKSERGRAVWKKKRANAGAVKLTSRAPAWLRMSPDHKRFELIPERADVVRKIYKMAAEGYGAFSICKALNQAHTPTFSTRSILWQESYIKKILHNRAVIGEFQPHKLQFINHKKVRVADGDVLPGYFPATISNALFHKATESIRQRTVNGSGRKGSSYVNLFSGILFCSNCGGKIRMHNRGERYGGRSLRCINALMKGAVECHAPSWNYDNFERNFLRHLRNIDVEYVVGGSKRDTKLAQLESAASQLEYEIYEYTKGISNFVLLVEKMDPKTELVEMQQRQTDLSHLRSKAKAALLKTNKEISALQAQNFSLTDSERKILIDKLASKNNGAEDVRRLLASEIRRVVEEIKLTSGISLSHIDVELGFVEGASALTKAQLREYGFGFIIKYKSGETGVVEPAIDFSLTTFPPTFGH